MEVLEMERKHTNGGAFERHSAPRKRPATAKASLLPSTCIHFFNHSPSNYQNGSPHGNDQCNDSSGGRLVPCMLRGRSNCWVDCARVHRCRCCRKCRPDPYHGLHCDGEGPASRCSWRQECSVWERMRSCGKGGFKHVSFSHKTKNNQFSPTLPPDSRLSPVGPRTGIFSSCLHSCPIIAASVNAYRDEELLQG